MPARSAHGQCATVTIQKIQEFRRNRLTTTIAKRKTCRSRTSNIETGALRACLDWALRNGLIVANRRLRISGRCPERRQSRKKRRALTDAEIDKFLGAAHLVEEERARFHAARRLSEGRRRAGPTRSCRDVPPVRRPFSGVPHSHRLRWHEAATLAGLMSMSRLGTSSWRRDSKNKTSRSVPFPTEHVQDLDDSRRRTQVRRDGLLCLVTSSS